MTHGRINVQYDLTPFTLSEACSASAVAQNTRSVKAAADPGIPIFQPG